MITAALDGIASSSSNSCLMAFVYKLLPEVKSNNIWMKILKIDSSYIQYIPEPTLQMQIYAVND